MADRPAGDPSHGMHPRWPGLWAAFVCILGVACAHYGVEFVGAVEAWPAPAWFFAIATAVLIAAGCITLGSRREMSPPPRRARVVLILLALAGGLTAHAAALIRLHHPPAGWLPDQLEPPASSTDTDALAMPIERLLIVRGVVREHLAAPNLPRGAQFDVHAPQRLNAGVGFRANSHSNLQLSLEVAAVQLAGAMQPATGVLRIFSQQAQESSLPELGTTIELTGQYRPPRQHGRMPSSLETSSTASSSGLQRARLVHDRSAGSLTVDALSGPRSTLVTIDPSPRVTFLPSVWLQHTRLAVQRHLASTLDSLSDRNSPASSAPSPSASALLTSMMLGQDDAALSPPVESDLARLGMAHVLSVSGFHLVIITACVIWVARALTDSHRTVAIISIVAIVLYALLVPLESPVIRSACQAIAVVLAGMHQRRYEPLNLLGYIAAIMLLIWPKELWSAGFQLSFLVTGGLLAFGPRWMQAVDQLLRWKPPGVRGRIRPPKAAFSAEVLKAVRMSLAAIIGTTLLAQTISSPVVIYHTGTLPLGGTVMGMLATPLTTLALIAGFAGLIISLALPALGAWLLWLAGGICHLVLDLAHFTRGASFLWADLPMIPAWVAIVTTLGIIILIASRKWPHRLLGSLAVIAGVSFLTLRCITANSLDPSLLARLERYDITQQSPASLLQTRDELILIDPGTGLGISPLEPPIRQAFALRRAIQSASRWRVSTVVISGAEPWRFDLLPEILTPLGVERVIIAPDLAAVARDQPGSPAQRLLRELARRQITVEPLDASLTTALARNLQLTIAPGSLRLELPQGRLEIDRPPQLLTTSRWSLTAQGATQKYLWLEGRWQQADNSLAPRAPSPLIRWYPSASD